MDQPGVHPKQSEPANIPSRRTHQMRNIWAWGVPSTTTTNGSNDAVLFSCSLPSGLPFVKCVEREHLAQPINEMFPARKQPGPNNRVTDTMDDVAQHLIGNLLPDDEEELLAGVINDFDHVKLQNQAEELEEYDVFRNSGGMELDVDPLETITVGTAKTSIINGTGSGSSQYSLQSCVGTVTGEHPFGEHPSRTLFVRNINSNVEDSELRSLFEPFGDIRSMYTATKHRGFVMISYYDIRDARTAMRTLQNKPLRRRKLDIHFSIPKENPSDKDMNQGTLVIFNLEPAVSNEELLRIFGAFGEVREIRETPQKRHHRFIEYYDVRAAEAALRSLNKSDIAGKRVKLEPSRPGGARRSFVQQINHDFEQDDARHTMLHLGSPSANSPPSLWSQLGSPTEHNQFNTLSENAFNSGMSPLGGNHITGLSPGYPPMKPIGKSSNRNILADHIFHGVSNFHNSHSFPEQHGGIVSASPLVSSAASSASTASGFTTLAGTPFLWANKHTLREHSQPSAFHSPPIGNSHFPNSITQRQGSLYRNLRGSFGPSEYFSQYHVGSAPSVLPLESNFGYNPESPDTSYMRQGKFGSIGPSRAGGNLVTNFGVHSRFNAPSVQSDLVGFEGPLEPGRNHAIGHMGDQEDSRMQYQLDLEKIVTGKDTRTTLMIKNIPNKYTSKMLLDVIDETHEGAYDFFYLPIDFKNKCNVGYAFINMTAPAYIVSFYKAFTGRKWEKFNSEKVVSLAYARIQGKSALINHFQNSSLMNEDKRCRPMLFDPKHIENGNKILADGTNISLKDGMQDGCDLSGDPTKDSFRLSSEIIGQLGSSPEGI
ncbi:protein MEI2-like 5 isoform X2 [Setaria italica]|uniref:protein MEI2-like 5 isoform X2 n=1 Tax=Setaria italica TaxID=4555 RepID=UPI000BE5A0F9|nr:protein MEI2-like 5 isoform X2 [Setaria italica]